MSDFDAFVFMIGVFVGMVLLTIALVVSGFPGAVSEVGARAVCDSHGLDLDSYDYIGGKSGFEFVKCKPVDPVPVFGVFENIGGDGK